MGKKTSTSTKGGRFVNPTDQARKDARRKELLKNRKQRQAVREAVIKSKDPEKIIEELIQTDQMQYNPRIECPFPERVMEDRRKRLLTTYERIISFAEKNKTNDAAKTSEYRKALATYESNRRRLIADYHAVKLAEGTTVELLQALPSGVPLPEEEDVEPMFNFSDTVEATDFDTNTVLSKHDWHAKVESAASLSSRLSYSYEGKASGRLPGGPPPLPLPDMLHDEFISLSAPAISSLKDAERRERNAHAPVPDNDVGEEQSEETLANARAARPYAAVPPPEFVGDVKDDRPVDPVTGQPLPERSEMFFNAHLNRQHARAGGVPANIPSSRPLFRPPEGYIPPPPGTFVRPPQFMPMHAPLPYRQHPVMGGSVHHPMVRPSWPSANNGPALIPSAFATAPAATITAQPQLKNLAKEVTKMIPTAVASQLRPGPHRPSLSDNRPASVRMFTPKSALITSHRPGVTNDLRPRLQPPITTNLASTRPSGTASKSVDSAYQDFLEQMKGYI